MRVRAGRLTDTDAKSLVRALVLMCLVAHAGLVSLTHHHTLTNRSLRASASGAEAGLGGETDGRQDSNREGYCLSCCLQRNFVSTARTISIPPDLRPEPVRLEIFASNPMRSGVSLILSNRAPPSTNA